MTQVLTRGDLVIVITRAFRAPRRMVFDAYTKPELLVRWLGVRNGWTLDICEVDLRVGGAYHWVWRKAANGKQMGVSGVYREIAAPELIVCTEKFDEAWYPGEAIDTVEFIERDATTTLSITMEFETKEARDGAANSDMERGMEESFVVLDAIFAAQE